MFASESEFREAKRQLLYKIKELDYSPFVENTVKKLDEFWDNLNCDSLIKPLQELQGEKSASDLKKKLVEEIKVGNSKYQSGKRKFEDLQVEYRAKINKLSSELWSDSQSSSEKIKNIILQVDCRPPQVNTPKYPSIELARPKNMVPVESDVKSLVVDGIEQPRIIYFLGKYYYQYNSRFPYIRSFDENGILKCDFNIRQFLSITFNLRVIDDIERVCRNNNDFTTLLIGMVCVNIAYHYCRLNAIKLPEWSPRHAHWSNERAFFDQFIATKIYNQFLVFLLEISSDIEGKHEMLDTCRYMLLNSLAWPTKELHEKFENFGLDVFRNFFMKDSKKYKFFLDRMVQSKKNLYHFYHYNHHKPVTYAHELLRLLYSLIGKEWLAEKYWPDYEGHDYQGCNYMSLKVVHSSGKWYKPLKLGYVSFDF